ncbi:MAG: hypothetical protein ACTTIV_05035 [Campylobacter sp.]
MAKLNASERLAKNEEQLKKLEEQRKLILNEIKEQNDQIFKDIGVKISNAVKSNEQFKIDFLNLIAEHSIDIKFFNEYIKIHR